MSLSMDSLTPLKPNEYVEKSIIEAILKGDLPPGKTLPAERILAEQLGVTRSTLREALHRLGRDGWISINQGKPTLVNDILRDGNLNILSGIIRHGEGFSVEFIKKLLWVRSDLAPSYTFFASENDSESIIDHLRKYKKLSDDPRKYASFDWELHYRLTLASGNPIYTLIINGFSAFYIELATKYFKNQKARASSLAYYRDLLILFIEGDSKKASLLMKEVMRESIDLVDW